MDLSYLITLGGKSSIHCAGGWLLLGATSTLRMVILVGYIVIATDWYRRERQAKSRRGIEALQELRWIFLLCGVCGYGLPILMAFAPLWSVTLLGLTWLSVVTWAYITRLKRLDIVYRDAEMIDAILNGKYEGIADPVEALAAIRADLKELVRKGV